VGGIRFEVSRTTLTKYPNTLLGNMFLPSNKHLRKPDKKGEYFFDRYFYAAISKLEDSFL
jgi:hypothetical protein